jgi:26S proteasome regulatory subunit N2
LYGLGLIHSSHGDNIVDYISNFVSNDKTDEVVQHGACLGLGLAALASGKKDIYSKLKDILFLDNAVSGESAAISMGLVMLGCGDNLKKTQKSEELTIEEENEEEEEEETSIVDEMFNTAHETAHEKIIRGLSIGIALTQYELEEGAESTINKLIGDKDPVLRYGGMFAIGLAYAGTSNNGAIRKLLHFAVSDVSDDVRRAAVMNLGFLLFKNPNQCPRLLKLLSSSYNPHVRYGVAMAIGIACAGTGIKEGIEILETLLEDRTDFVRQGAYIGLALVLIQQTEGQNKKVTEIRKRIEDGWTGKHEILSKVGAILASGITNK